MALGTFHNLSVLQLAYLGENNSTPGLLGTQFI